MSAKDSEDYNRSENNSGDESSDHNDLSEFDAKEFVRAASDGLLDKIKVLTKGSEHDVRGSVGRDALRQAAANGHVKVVRALMAAGVPIDACSTFQESTLMQASIHGHIKVVELLLAAGANVSTANKFGWTAIHHAATMGHSEIVESLLEAGAPVDACPEETPCTTKQTTPLMTAVQGVGNCKVVEVLLAAGADVAAANGDGWTALYYAAKRGHVEIATALLAAGAPVDGCSTARGTPLLEASKNGHLKVVELLLAAGANVEAFDRYGLTALVHAVFKGHAEIVELLLAAGVNIEVSGTLGLTALGWAAKKGHIEILRILIKAGAKVESSKVSRVPLLLAVKKQHADVVRELLAAGADPDGGKHFYKRQPDGTLKVIGDHDTPLMKAAFIEDINMVRILLAGGAHANIVTIKDKRRRTALMRAAGANDLEVVRVLLEAGADPFVQRDTIENQSPGSVPWTALNSARKYATRELLKREMNRRKAAALSVMPAQLPWYIRQEIMRLACSWKPLSRLFS